MFFFDILFLSNYIVHIMTFWYVLVLIVIRLKSLVMNVRMTGRQP